MTLTQEITLDIYEQPYFVYVNAKQKDNISRILIITLTAKGDEMKPDTSDLAVFRALKPDGTSVLNPATIGEDGKITVALTDQTLAAAGNVEADVSVKHGDEVISSVTMYIQVTRAPINAKQIKSDNEFLLLIEAKDAAEAAAKLAAASERAAGEHATAAEKSAGAAAGSASKAAESEQTAGEHATAADIAKAAAEAAALLAKSWARGETDSREGEDEDNAKYYAAQALIAAIQAAEAAEDAQRVSQGAIGYYDTPELLRERHPEAEDGNWAIVGSTDTIWVWDSDDQVWANTGNKIDLSQYYTRTEVDDLLAGLEETVTASLDTKVSAATSRSWDVSVPASGWHASTATWPEAGLTAKWETTIAVPGMVAQMNSAMTTHTGGTVAAYGQWRWLDTAADAVTLYSDNTSVPTAAFTLRITEVR